MGGQQKETVNAISKLTLIIFYFGIWALDNWLIIYFFTIIFTKWSPHELLWTPLSMLEKLH